MEKIQFRDLPFATRLATAASFFMAWVMFAEFVIDRYGFDRLLPYYHIGDLCVYDFVAAASVALFWIVTHVGPTSRGQRDSKHASP